MTRSPAPVLLPRRLIVARRRTPGLFLLLAVRATRNLKGKCPDGTPPPCGARPGSVRRAQRENAGSVRGIGRALGVRYVVDGDAALAALERIPPTAFERFYLSLEIFDTLRADLRFRRLAVSLGG